jgi:hypothetical protein
VLDVTASQNFQFTFSQCNSPNNNIVLVTVDSGLLGITSPFVVGDQLIGVFSKQGNNCWNLKLTSSIDNSIIEIDFLGNLCPLKFNYSYYKSVNSANNDFSAVGFGHGTKQ